jgi:hypothetical protein
MAKLNLRFKFGNNDRGKILGLLLLLISIDLDRAA